VLKQYSFCCLFEREKKLSNKDISHIANYTFF